MSTTRGVLLRGLAPSDIGAIHDLEAAAYEPALHVSDQALLRLIALYPDGAIGGFEGGRLCGYAFGVPLAAGTILDLHTPLAAIPEGADVFYIHDVAVAARCRGGGIGRRLATALLDLARARGFARAELVSVQGSAPFWERFGFRAVREFEYAPGAASRQMVADL
jgi:ribosomal protein S18 acetylase RimI-like enzyme